jgi:hypothetical protein
MIKYFSFNALSSIYIRETHELNIIKYNKIICKNKVVILR